MAGKLGQEPNRRKSSQSAEKKHAARIVDALILRASRRAELAISSARAVFAALVLVRFWTLGERGSPEWVTRSAIELPALTATTVLSLLLVLVVVRRGISQWVLDMSVTLDAVACSLTLLPAIICPWATYRGLLNMPDIAIVPVLCLSAGIRMSLRSALVGAFASFTSFAALVWLDRLRNHAILEYTHTSVALYFTYLAAAAVLGMVLATRTRAIAEQAARHAERAEAARSGLSRVLQDNHDVRSLISSARINADLLVRSLGRPEKEAAVSTGSALRDDLGSLAEMVDGSRDRAYLELALSASGARTDVVAVAREVLRAVAQRFDHVALELIEDGSAPQAWVADGRQGLERMLLNLLINACEGDGTKGASRVRLEVAQRSGMAEIGVADNGPGFPSSLLTYRGERFASTKKHGSGLGLFLVESVAIAGGGTLQIENTAEGARATVCLPLEAKTVASG